MGRYGNQIGYHSVDFTTECYNTLTEAGFNVDDVSWHNDAVDSLNVNEITIFIPNSDEDEPNEEKFNRFLIIKDEDYGTGNYLKLVDTIEEVITFLRCYPKRLEIKKEKRINI